MIKTAKLSLVQRLLAGHQVRESSASAPPIPGVCGGAVGEEVPYLQKPFTVEELLEQIRLVM